MDIIVRLLVMGGVYAFFYGISYFFSKRYAQKKEKQQLEKEDGEKKDR